MLLKLIFELILVVHRPTSSARNIAALITMKCGQLILFSRRESADSRTESKDNELNDNFYHKRNLPSINYHNLYYLLTITSTQRRQSHWSSSPVALWHALTKRLYLYAYTIPISHTRAAELDEAWLHQEVQETVGSTTPIILWSGSHIVPPHTVGHRYTCSAYLCGRRYYGGYVTISSDEWITRKLWWCYWHEGPNDIDWLVPVGQPNNDSGIPWITTTHTNLIQRIRWQKSKS